jgi:hypothetical protein
MVVAAIEKALRPWTRKKQARRAVDRALDGMPYEIRYGSEFTGMKQRASEAACCYCRSTVKRLIEYPSAPPMKTSDKK